MRRKYLVRLRPKLVYRTATRLAFRNARARPARPNKCTLRHAALPPPFSLSLSLSLSLSRLHGYRPAGQKFRRVSERMLTAKRERAALRARLVIPG